MKSLFFILTIFLSLNVNAIEDFSSDGCSMYPDGVPGYEPNMWYHCCFTHDMSYWVGGSEAQKVEADINLDRCVSESTFQAHGFLMRLGVSYGGVPDTYMPWRWGYGFEEERSYKNMSSSEKVAAFDKFDGIIGFIESQKDMLSQEQLSFMIARYELLRHNLAVDLKLSHEEETETMEERVEQIRRIYNLKEK